MRGEVKDKKGGGSEMLGREEEEEGAETRLGVNLYGRVGQRPNHFRARLGHGMGDSLCWKRLEGNDAASHWNGE